MHYQPKVGRGHDSAWMRVFFLVDWENIIESILSHLPCTIWIKWISFICIGIEAIDYETWPSFIQHS